eukprot:scaffold24667_cov19-Tisochrysis_lutea.AAC.1
MRLLEKFQTASMHPLIGSCPTTTFLSLFTHSCLRNVVTPTDSEQASFCRGLCCILRHTILQENGRRTILWKRAAEAQELIHFMFYQVSGISVLLSCPHMPTWHTQKKEAAP